MHHSQGIMHQLKSWAELPSWHPDEVSSGLLHQLWHEAAVPAALQDPLAVNTALFNKPGNGTQHDQVTGTFKTNHYVSILRECKIGGAKVPCKDFFTWVPTDSGVISGFGAIILWKTYQCLDKDKDKAKEKEKDKDKEKEKGKDKDNIKKKWGRPHW